MAREESDPADRKDLLPDDLRSDTSAAWRRFLDRTAYRLVRQ